MIERYIDDFLYHSSYYTLFWLSLVYFLILYFMLAPLFNSACKWLCAKNILQKITQKEVPSKQIFFEMKYSLLSIIIFGTSILPIVYFIRMGAIHLLPNTIFNVLLGIILLNLWNEVHFFIVHRIMHLPFFMKNVHYIHHQSKVPTVYSVYSFHWFEALLLSTVPLTIALVLPFAALAIVVYPLCSVLINFSGHCNYRFGSGNGKLWTRFGTNHNDHHFKSKKNYGFFLPFFDRIYSLFANHKTK